MKYFYKDVRLDYNVDRSMIHIESEGDTSRTGHFYFRVERTIGDGLYTYYYYPLEGSLLMCLFFNMNLDEFQKMYDKYNEYFRYAQKTWPLFCNAYLRGRNGDFDDPFIYRFRDFGGEDNRTYAWLLCQTVPYISPKEINNADQYEHALSLIRYANNMLKEIQDNNISSKDKFLINAEEAGRIFIRQLQKGLIKEVLKNI